MMEGGRGAGPRLHAAPGSDPRIRARRLKAVKRLRTTKTVKTAKRLKKPKRLKTLKSPKTLKALESMKSAQMLSPTAEDFAERRHGGSEPILAFDANSPRTITIPGRSPSNEASGQSWRLRRERLQPKVKGHARRARAGAGWELWVSPR